EEIHLRAAHGQSRRSAASRTRHRRDRLSYPRAIPAGGRPMNARSGYFRYDQNTEGVYRKLVLRCPAPRFFRVTGTSPNVLAIHLHQYSSSMMTGNPGSRSVIRISRSVRTARNPFVQSRTGSRKSERATRFPNLETAALFEGTPSIPPPAT